MINLLPPDMKEAYRYGRHNRVLVRWVFVIVASWAVGIALTAGGVIYLNRTISSTNQVLGQDQKQLKSLNETSVQSQVSDISNNLKLAETVLSKEILFSKLLQQLAAVTPNNTILSGLAITQTSGGVDLTAETTNYSAATQLQTNLADPKNQIFSTADIVSVQCGGSQSTNPLYPCLVDIRALFANNNPYLFINSKSGSGS